jgi:hypothetical protein
MVMRPFSLLKWIPLVLLAGCAVGPSEGGTGRAASTGPTWDEKAYGETIDNARKLAQEKARDKVEGYLEEHYPNIGWRPTIQRLLKAGVVTVDDPKQGELDHLRGYEATAHVDLRDENLRKLQVDVDQAQEQAREQAQENAVFWRHILLGRILAALVALFLIVGGYLRLEELTRGYYTTLLRVGAGAVMLLIAAVVLLVRI